MRAIFQGETVAESSQTVVVDGIRYFPASAVDQSFLEASEMTTFCPDKGRASYFNLKHSGSTQLNAVFVYKDASEAFSHIKGWYGFWAQANSKPGDLAVVD